VESSGPREAHAEAKGDEVDNEVLQAQEVQPEGEANAIAGG